MVLGLVAVLTVLTKPLLWIRVILVSKPDIFEQHCIRYAPWVKYDSKPRSFRLSYEGIYYRSDRVRLVGLLLKP